MKRRNIHSKGKDKLYLLCFTALKYRSRLKLGKENHTLIPVILLKILIKKKKRK